jgi:hypothetical protein
MRCSLRNPVLGSCTRRACRKRGGLILVGRLTPRRGSSRWWMVRTSSCGCPCYPQPRYTWHAWYALIVCIRVLIHRVVAFRNCAGIVRRAVDWWRRVCHRVRIGILIRRRLGRVLPVAVGVLRHGRMSAMLWWASITIASSSQQTTRGKYLLSQMWPLYSVVASL